MYEAAGGKDLQATLVIDDQDAGQRLASVTHFDDGSCLSEEATVDLAGRLVRAESVLSGSAVSDARIVLEPESGAAELSVRGMQVRWAVPNDLPWVWAPLLDPASSTETIATPLATLIALRAARDHEAVRMVDLAAFRSDSIMIDQLVVPTDARSGIVVIGTDAVDVRDGLPERLHVAALGVDLNARSGDGLLELLASFSCLPTERSKT